MASEHNLARLAEAALERHGDYPALWFEGEWHSSGALAERARRAAGGLRELGVAPGDRVAVLMANCPEVGIAYNAVWRAGAVLTPAIFLLSTTELHNLLRHSGARVVITSSDFAPMVDEAREGIDTVVASVDDLEESEPAPVVDRDDADLAALMYTGGTTGRAKGVMLTHEALWRAGAAGHEMSYVPGVNRTLVTLPLAHAYGLLVTAVHLHAREAGVTALLRWFDPVSFLQLVQERSVQISAIVPSMLQALLACPLEDFDLSSLRHLVCGAAPLPAQPARTFAARVPNVELREGYGLTECCALLAGNPPDRTRRGSVGLPAPGVEVRIVDDAGAALPSGEVGEICCRSPFTMAGYWGDPAASAAAARGGWLHTGDMGYLDDDGYLYIVDRKKDLIIRGGFNVFPRDVEDVLHEHPAVAAAGVVGRPDEAHGEEVVAFVQLDGGAVEPDELRDFAKERLSAYKYPREIRIVPQIPLTPVGKVDRKALRVLVRGEE